HYHVLVVVAGAAGRRLERAQLRVSLQRGVVERRHPLPACDHFGQAGQLAAADDRVGLGGPPVVARPRGAGLGETGVVLGAGWPGPRGGRRGRPKRSARPPRGPTRWGGKRATAAPAPTPPAATPSSVEPCACAASSTSHTPRRRHRSASWGVERPTIPPMCT